MPCWDIALAWHQRQLLSNAARNVSCTKPPATIDLIEGVRQVQLADLHHVHTPTLECALACCDAALGCPRAIVHWATADFGKLILALAS